MSFRLRLMFALAVAALIPLAPLLWFVNQSLRTSIESIAPDETGAAIQSGMELVRAELRGLREDLPLDLDLMMRTGSPPDEREGIPPNLSPHRTLFVNGGNGWYRWENSAWVESPAPPEDSETQFGQFPERVQARSTDPSGREWVLIHELPETFRESASALQRAAADWAVSSEQRERLIVSLTITFALVYLIAVALAISVGLVVLSPLTRRIGRLTDVAESIRTGNEDVRADESGGGETERLARTFNLMLERLVDSRAHAAEMEKRAAWRELAPVLAHEIKNPLTPIQLAVQQVAESYKGDDERYARTLATAREIVDEEIERLRKLVREFGDFARAPEPEPEPVDLPGFMEDLAGLYGDRVEVLNRCDGDAVFDPEQVRRALVNLLDNACAAEEENDDPRVRFTCEHTDNELRFIVEDNGPGVPEELRESIFEPYVTTKSNGIGLGLPVVRTTAEQHGGSVRVEKSEVFYGAMFTFVVKENNLP